MSFNFAVASSEQKSIAFERRARIASRWRGEGAKEAHEFVDVSGRLANVAVELCCSSLSSVVLSSGVDVRPLLAHDRAMSGCRRRHGAAAKRSAPQGEHWGGARVDLDAPGPRARTQLPCRVCRLDGSPSEKAGVVRTVRESRQSF